MIFREIILYFSVFKNIFVKSGSDELVETDWADLKERLQTCYPTEGAACKVSEIFVGISYLLFLP